MNLSYLVKNLIHGLADSFDRLASGNFLFLNKSDFIVAKGISRRKTCESCFVGAVGQNDVGNKADSDSQLNQGHNRLVAFGFGGNESSIVLGTTGTELSEAPYVELSRSRDLEISDDTTVAAFVSSAETRRMTPQMRRIVAAARQAMRKSGVEQPDAILCATRWGCMMQSMRFLTDMLDSDEQQLKPTPFIQSTHNTVASLIAILTSNHGYNATYAQGAQSLDCALMDIRTQMALGLIRTALVLEFDEQVDTWDEVLNHIAQRTHAIARAYIYKKEGL